MDYETINVVIYLYPILYESSEILSAVTIDKGGKYHTIVNPSRIINGPLSGVGEELQSPLKEEWESFIKDCEWLITETGFTVIDSDPSKVSKKSEYFIVYGIDDTPCGSIAFDLRLSDHPFDAKFPDEYKDIVLDYFKEHDILDDTATKAGIDFQVEKVTVGSVKEDSWDRAFNRLYLLLRRMKSKIKIRLKTRNRNR